MKLKGLAKAIKMLEKLRDGEIQNKIDSIEWSGNHDTLDQQKDEMFNEAFGIVDAAIDNLLEIKNLQLDQF